MKNNRCGIVRDLIPLYIDGVCSEESTEMVRNHIENCKECRDIYESMKDESIEASVYNETEKVIGRHRQKERMFAMKLGLLLAAAFMIPFMIGLLYMAGTGSVRFIDILVTASGILLAATLILVPVMSKKKKLVKTILFSTAGILLVEMFAIISEGGSTNFVTVWISTIFGLSIPLLPVIIYGIELKKPWKDNRGFIILAWDTIWLFLTCIVNSFGNLQGIRESLGTAAYFMVLIWLIFLICRYYKGSALQKFAFSSIFTGLFFGLGNDVFSWLFDGRHEFYLAKADLSLFFNGGVHMGSEVFNASICLLIMLISLALALMIFAVDYLFKGKRK